MTPARELSDRLASLYRNERQAMADFLIALSVFDQRRAWRELGFPSLWVYLTRELKLSSTAAFQRKTVENLRVARRECNQLAARRAFGDQRVDRYARRKDRSRGRTASDGTGRTGRAAPPPVPDALAPFT